MNKNITTTTSRINLKYQLTMIAAMAAVSIGYSAIILGLNNWHLKIFSKLHESLNECKVKEFSTIRSEVNPVFVRDFSGLLI